MKTSIDQSKLNYINEKLSLGNNAHAKTHPGESEERQPVHTVYGGAHLFKANTAVRISELALKGFKEFAPNAEVFRSGLGMECSSELAKKVYDRVEKKLKEEALEDFRIDFEDGFGARPDDEEDETALAAATEVAKGMREGTLPPYLGIRVKTFSEEHKNRGIRTLDLFITTLSELSDGKLPDNFCVVLPKITSREQVTAMVDCFEALEENTQLAPGSLKMELMVETPETIIGPRGECPMLEFVEAGKGRVRGAHFGTYDFTACMNITAKYQAMDHGTCDFAKNFMKVSLAGTGVWLSDGATNVMPVGPHKGDLTEEQKRENEEVVHDAWKLSYGHIRHSLKNGFYQGWDLHPVQIPVRYGALYCFFLEGLEETQARLKQFMEAAAKATLTGAIFDDAATGQGLLNYFLRGLNCGAIEMEDVLATGLTLEEIRTRSFAKILKMRTGQK
ncbi:MAG: phosphoenolpyruvate kinase [Halobacteriovorax sp.]|nr:phosphoenolpyruvate kinase [Halobacteriovorax sp.]|tara:strand:- start:153555 stop:154898 length:1344 start_codon:yes stop_codon:yes gene_type:complete